MTTKIAIKNINKELIAEIFLYSCYLEIFLLVLFLV